MTRKIWKYPLKHHTPLQVENYSKVVLVDWDIREDVRNPYPTIWIEHVDTGINMTFQFFSTGQDIPDDAGTHFGSCGCADAFVWHVYGRPGRKHERV
jgi:hypothetical protein